jgi:hypothetical protein
MRKKALERAWENAEKKEEEKVKEGVGTTTTKIRHLNLQVTGLNSSFPAERLKSRY